MDNLVLIRVAAVLEQRLAGSALLELRQEAELRWRLLFAGDSHRTSVVVSLASESPWIGCAGPPWHGRGPAPSRFTALCARALSGRVFGHAIKAAAERVVTLSFAGGSALVAELLPRRPNLLLLDGERRVLASACRRRSDAVRLTPGTDYAPPERPAASVDPFLADVAAIDRAVETALREGLDLAPALARGTFGLGAAASALAVAESRAYGRSLGTVVKDRVGQVARGEVDPVMEGPAEIDAMAALGRLEPGCCRLWPWAPQALVPLGGRLSLAHAAETAGRYYDAVERARAVRARIAGIEGVLGQERERIRDAVRRTTADGALLGEDRPTRRWAEALLAGLRVARRDGDRVGVPDPYDAEGPWLSIPIPPGQSLESAADALYQRERRARRGHPIIERRLEQLAEKGRRLEAIARRFCGPLGAEEAEALVEALREEGVPLDLARPPRAGRGERAITLPRLEGVRVVPSVDGWTILIGKGAQHNHRLTFKIAGPEDFWFHVRGVPGAHVVVRNDERKPRPPHPTLVQAAAAAAWYSDAREESAVDVQWTRRKYVRPLSRSGPGTVRLKRFETIRVRPAAPMLDEGPDGRRR